MELEYRGFFGPHAMDGWEIALWAAAGYIAVMVLVRMMSARRGEVLRELRDRAEAQPRQAPKKTPAEEVTS